MSVALVMHRTVLAVLCLSVACAAQVSDAVNQTFTITGTVRIPGTYELRPGLHIADAIAIAQGFADFAEKKKIRLIRGDKQFRFNYVAFEHREALEANILLASGDKIIVP